MANHYNNLEQERAYLENLLATRINFYLVFVSFYFVAVFGVEEEGTIQNMRSIAFLFGGIVSFLMALYVWRTTLLVEKVLSNLREEYDDHPYSKAYDAFEKLSNQDMNSFASKKSIKKRIIKRAYAICSISANWYIVILIWSFALAFFILAIVSWLTG